MQVKEGEAQHHAEHRIADLQFTKYPLELSLFDQSKVAFMSFEKGEVFGVVIDSKAVYLTLKNLFLFVWNHAET